MKKANRWKEHESYSPKRKHDLKRNSGSRVGHGEELILELLTICRPLLFGGLSVRYASGVLRTRIRAYD